MSVTKTSNKCDYYLCLEGLGAERRSEKEEEVDPSQLFGAIGDGMWTDS